VAVFLPLIFLPGLIGRVFSELAVTITGAVVLSSFVALTLSPMMTSKLLKPSTELRGPAKWVSGLLDRLQASYRNSLQIVLKFPVLVLPMVGAALGGSAFMFSQLPGELTPPQDRGNFFGFVGAHQGASFEYMSQQMLQAEEIVTEYVENGELRRVLVVSPGWGGSGFNSGIVIGSMVHWDDRRPGQEILNEINARLGNLPGVRAFVSMRSPLGGGGGGGDDMQFVLQGPDYAALDAEADRLIADINQNTPNLIRARKDYQPTAPRLLVDIDRERAAALGVSVSDIGRTLQTHLGSRRVGQFIDRGEPAGRTRQPE